MDDRGISDNELRDLMIFHLRQSLEDELLRGNLPPELAKIVDEDPEAVVQNLFALLAPGVQQRAGADPKAFETKPTKLSQEQLQALMLALASLRASAARGADVDLDGALLFCNRGRKMLKQQRWIDAKRHFQRATEIKPTLKAAWLGLADAQEKLGEIEQAAETRSRANSM